MTKRYVVDASIAVKWYVPETHSDAAERLLDGTAELCAPDLLLPEFGSIIWKKIRRRELTHQQGRAIIDALLAVPISQYPARGLLEPAFEAAIQTAQTVYDCTYLALAVSLDCQMVTADQKFYRALATGSLAKHLLWVADIP